MINGQKYQSGFCTNGQHEGMRPRSPSGRPMKVCIQPDTCDCKCHTRRTRMFEMAEEPRELGDNPEYVAFQPHLWMPTYEDRVQVKVEQLSVRYDSDSEPEFKPSPSGRTPKGQLEYWVKEAVDTWLSNEGEYDDGTSLCTPATLAAMVASQQGVPEPSQGAIYSVLKRWGEIGYVKLGEKPFRVKCMTIAGMAHGLDFLKGKAALVKS